MPNPWFILGGVLLVLALCAGSAYEGHSYGVDSQKVEDQKEFDAINAKLAQQKTDAAAILATVNAANLALAVERDKLKTSLGEQDAKNRKATLVLNANLATAKLQFRTAQGSGCGDSSSGTGSPGATSSSPQSSAVVQLPDKITIDLRQFALDADNLANDYKLCYGYATKVK